LALLAKATRTAVQEVDTVMDWSMENSLVQKPSGCRAPSCLQQAIQVVHVNRLLPCVSLPAFGDETDDEPDTDDQPNTPDQAQVPDEVIQDVPGLFEESTLPQPQNSQTMDSQEPDSQFLDTQDQGSQASRQSTRVRKLPASLEPYILG